MICLEFRHLGHPLLNACSLHIWARTDSTIWRAQKSIRSYKRKPVNLRGLWETLQFSLCAWSKRGCLFFLLAGAAVCSLSCGCQPGSQARRAEGKIEADVCRREPLRRTQHLPGCSELSTSPALTASDSPSRRWGIWMCVCWRWWFYSTGPVKCKMKGERTGSVTQPGSGFQSRQLPQKLHDIHYLLRSLWHIQPPLLPAAFR